MSESVDRTVGLPYLHPHRIPRVAVAAFSFLASRPRALLIPRVYAAVSGIHYTSAELPVVPLPFPDAPFHVNAGFLVVGYAGVLCGGVIITFENSPHPTLCTLRAIHSTERDPTWIVLVCDRPAIETGVTVSKSALVYIIRLPCLVEARRVRRAIITLFKHHKGISDNDAAFLTFATVEELLASAATIGEVSDVKCTHKLPPAQYEQLAELIVSKQMVSVVNAALPLLTSTANTPHTVNLSQRQMGLPYYANSARRNSGTVMNSDNNEVNHSSIDDQEHPNHLRGEDCTTTNTAMREILSRELSARRQWLLEEQHRASLAAEAQQGVETSLRLTQERLNSVRAARHAAQQEAEQLAVRVADAEREWVEDTAAAASLRREGHARLAALEEEYNDRIAFEWRALHTLREARESQAEKKRQLAQRLKELRAQRDALLPEVEQLTQQLRDAKLKQWKPHAQRRSSKSSEEEKYKEALTQNTALRRVLQTVQEKCDAAEQQEADLAKDLHAFYDDVAALEGRRMLLALELEMLSATGAVAAAPLREAEVELEKEREIAKEERRQITSRLLVQQERTKRVSAAKESAEETLRRLRAHFSN